MQSTSQIDIKNEISPPTIHLFLTVEQNLLALNRYVSTLILPNFTYLTTYDISPILQAAIYYGWLEPIQYLLEVGKYPIASIRSAIVKEVVHQGHLHILQYFIQRQHVIPSAPLLQIAAKSGCLAIIKWLREQYQIALSVPNHDNDFHLNFFVWIVRKGHVDILKWLVQHENFNINEINKSVNLVQEACHHEQWQVLQWLVVEQGLVFKPGKYGKKIYLALSQYMTDFPTTTHGFVKFLHYIGDNESWPLLYEVFKQVALNIPDLQASAEWLRWLEQKYLAAMKNANDADKEKIIHQYDKLFC